MCVKVCERRQIRPTVHVCKCDSVCVCETDAGREVLMMMVCVRVCEQGGVGGCVRLRDSVCVRK